MKEPKTEQKNPYEEEIQDPPLLISARFAQITTVVFLLLLTLLPLTRNLRELTRKDGWAPIVTFFQHPTEAARERLQAKKETNPVITRTTPNFIEHRETWETRLEDEAFFTKPARRVMQRFLTGTLNEGNRKTVIGKNGWLFYRPAIDAVTGYGPLTPEPDSVAKDPNRPPWNGPLDVILEFQEQLAEAGVELILLPIPVKPMVLPEQLGSRAEAPLLHPDATAFYDQLREHGVDVVDLTGPFATWSESFPVYLKQDTHWTPQGMERCAAHLAAYLQRKPWFATLTPSPGRFTSEAGTRQHSGDLAEKLDGTTFPAETVTIHRVQDRDTPPPSEAETKEPDPEKREAMKHARLDHFIRDPDAPIVLLGDSFTNIFAQADMKWGQHAGFAQHLARELGMPIDTIAQNGQASTGVRTALARRAGAREGKKAVIWAIAARDLFLSETVARETQVEWKPVVFNTAPKPDRVVAPTGLVIRGELLRTSRMADPKTAPYPSTLLATKYQVLDVVSGDYEPGEILVYHWGFRDRKVQAAAAYAAGDIHTLTLVPFETKGDLQTINRSDTLDEFELFDFFWAESAAGQ